MKGLRPGAGGDYLLEVSGGDRDAPVDEVVRADAVVLAIPAYDAAGLLASVCPEAAGILRTVRYVSTGTMSLAYKRDASVERLGGFGVLVPAEREATAERRHLVLDQVRSPRSRRALAAEGLLRRLAQSGQHATGRRRTSGAWSRRS